MRTHGRCEHAQRRAALPPWAEQPGAACCVPPDARPTAYGPCRCMCGTWHCSLPQLSRAPLAAHERQAAALSHKAACRPAFPPPRPGSAAWGAGPQLGPGRRSWHCCCRLSGKSFFNACSRDASRRAPPWAFFIPFHTYACSRDASCRACPLVCTPHSEPLFRFFSNAAAALHALLRELKTPPPLPAAAA